MMQAILDLAQFIMIAFIATRVGDIDSQVKQIQKRKGIVADSMRRQGIDPDKVKSNHAEINVICGKRFEEDLIK